VKRPPAGEPATEPGERIAKRKTVGKRPALARQSYDGGAPTNFLYTVFYLAR
jgi:hypothetical protein